jgi:D-cysteine desulfhydrase family pyridoxal phosphate-dependent enzyme
MSIDAQPRFSLATLPTPLKEAGRLREALGGKSSCPRILLKRDDLTGLAFGGNKARKLEFLVAHALSLQSTVLVTSGSVQSNHARMTAAAARVAGLRVTLVLTSRSDLPEFQGNFFLDTLLGAEIHFIPPHTDPRIGMGEEESSKVAEVMSSLRIQGELPYEIPVGGSSPVGALGYVAGTAEILRQLNEIESSPSRLYYAAGSRGTQVGLTLGAKLYGAPYRLFGIAVGGGDPERTLRAVTIAEDASQLIGSNFEFSSADLVVDQNYIGPGYAITTPECVDAIRLLARHEGIFLDPVYTGKAMAALIDHVRRRMIDPAETVVFLHTGGTPALFAYTSDFATYPASSSAPRS